MPVRHVAVPVDHGLEIIKTDQSVFIRENRLPKISEMRRESRRQQILQAALACFSEDGFHQTGMADIVRRSGMSHGAVYGYFQSKDEIIEALADDRHEGEAILNSTAQRIEDPIEGLRELVRVYANGLIDPAASQRRRVAVHGWAEALRNPRVHARIVEGINIPRSLIVGLVEQAQRIGRLSDDLSANAVARCFVALFQGFVLQVVWGEDVDVESCVAALDRMFRDWRIQIRSRRGDDDPASLRPARGVWGGPRRWRYLRASRGESRRRPGRVRKSPAGRRTTRRARHLAVRPDSSHGTIRDQALLGKGQTDADELAGSLGHRLPHRRRRRSAGGGQRLELLSAMDLCTLSRRIGRHADFPAFRFTTRDDAPEFHWTSSLAGAARRGLPRRLFLGISRNSAVASRSPRD